MEKTVVEIDDVTMQFRMNTERILSFKEFMTRSFRGKNKYQDFVALNHVSLNVEKGETFGIIGHNGAGKSTLLKVVAGILKPTEGHVRIKGNIVPMLELGSGFDMDLTGKENIFLNGAILGYQEDFLKSKYDEIVSFSELETFMDMPIRNYSSGMLARLAFSIASLVDPEILIVDEILAVGDTAFQEKSGERMKSLIRNGTAVLLVSHSLEQIQAMCDKVAWLDHGSVRMVGPPEPVCAEYKASIL